MNSVEHNINNKYGKSAYAVKFKSNENSAAIPMSYDINPIQQVELPDMYYMPENYKKPKTARENFEKFDVFHMVTPWLEHPFVMLALCAGMSFGIDAFDKSCNKTYEHSILGKATKFGDRIEKSKVIQNKNTQSVLHSIKDGWGKVKTVALKNSVIYSMAKTPSCPEWSMPKDEAKHTEYRIVSKFKELATALDFVPNGAAVEGNRFERMIPQNKVIDLKRLAPDKEELDYLKQTYQVKYGWKVPSEEGANRLILRRLGKSEAEISDIIRGANAATVVREELLKKSGLTQEEIIKIMHDETGETIELVKKAVANLEGTKVISQFPLFNLLKFPGVRQPLASADTANNIKNRARSLSDGAETKTGRFMARLVQKTHRGFTFGGSKFGVLLFMAPIIYETLINTKKADRKEKVGTFTSGIINAVSWVFTFPIALKAIHAYGGIQYAGMGEDKVAEYKNEINEFNARVKNNEFESYADYKHAKGDLKGRLKDLRKVENQSFLTRTLRGLSRFSKLDLLKIESYRGGKPAANFARKIPNFLKDYVVYAPGRFLIFMIVGLGLMDKLINACTSKIFGKSYDASKQEDIDNSKVHQEEYTMNDLRARMLEVQKRKMNPSEEVEKTTENTQLDIPNPARRMLDNRQFSQNQTADIMNQSGKASEKLLDDTKSVLQDKPENTEESINDSLQKEAAKTINPQTVANQDSQNTSKNNVQPVKRDNYTYIPSPENILNKREPHENANKYIPAQTGIVLKQTFDNSGLESALRRADRAEKRAISTLAGNFGNA